VVACADAIAVAHGWTRFVAVQMQYSLVERSVEREVLPMAATLDLALTAWAPLGGGVLTGKYGSGRAGGARVTDNPSAPAFVNERSLGIARVVGEVAAATGPSASQVALAWLRAQPGLVIPIVGGRRLAQTADNLGRLAATLPADALARLDQASRIPLGFPQDSLALPFVREIIYAGAYAQIDNRRWGGRR
jgi:aryl-alcohol dehydrogenase-like predicted oxidoreductase